MPQLTESFIRGVLAGIGAQDNARNRSFLREWNRYEGPQTTASNNPLHTTQGAPGASNYNSVGVKIYPDEQTGIAATVQTLLNGKYPNVVAFLRGQDVPGTELARDVNTWGTTHFAQQLAGGEVPASSETAVTGETVPPGTVAAGTPANIPADAYQDWLIRGSQLYPEWNSLADKAIQAEEVGATWIDGVGWVSQSYLGASPNTPGAFVDSDGNWVVAGDQTVWMTPEEYDRFRELDAEVENLETEFSAKFGPQALEDFITRNEYIWQTDPRNIDADNAAARFDRQFDVITEAAKIAADRFQAQSDQLQQAFESQAGQGRPNQIDTSATNLSSRPGSPFAIPTPQRYVSFEALFSDSLNKLRENLPDVPDRPYYPGGAPPESRDIGSARREAEALGRRRSSSEGPTGPPEIPGARAIVSRGRGFERAFGNEEPAPPYRRSTAALRTSPMPEFAPPGSGDLRTFAGQRVIETSPAAPVSQLPTVPRPATTPEPFSSNLGSFGRRYASRIRGSLLG